jgi:ariadne-1
MLPVGRGLARLFFTSIRVCFGGYLENLVSDGPSCVHMTCPQYKCPLVITAGSIAELCLPEVYEKYMKYLTRNFIDGSAYMHWCPAASCEYVAIGTNIETITCKCSMVYCTRCGGESHQPCSCDTVQKWVIKNTSESENANWLLVNTKPCPACNRRIEKNQGCNHMTCSICKHEFCWLCMKNWSGHNGNSYTCNEFKPEEENVSNAMSAKALLDR